MSDVVQIFDSTLRDGAQAEGISFSVEDKLMIAHRLDDLGVHYIEGGWPNPTNPKDLEFFLRAKGQAFKHARITAFGSTRRAGNRPEDDPTLNTLLRAETEVVTIFGKSWDLHVKEVLRTTLDENLRLVEDSVAYLKTHGREVVYDAEHFFDGYKNDPKYAMATLLAAQEGGAAILVLCDTNGGTLTSEAYEIVEAVKKEIGIPFGIHTHNDAGMGVANTIAAVELGAAQVQGTINGYGERCGNANLCAIIPTIELKLSKTCIGRQKLRELMEVSRFVSELANVYHDHRQPYVGESAFAHKGGAHVDGVMKVARSFEHIDPELVGNSRRFLVSDQSGGGTMVHKLQKLKPGLKKTDPEVAAVLAEVKAKENEGYVFEAAEGSFEVLARKAMGLYRDPFELISYRTVVLKDDRQMQVEAIVKLRVNGEVQHTVAEGDGPVNALDRALRKALEGAYPSLRQVHLEDYKVRVLSSGDGTAAKVRVLIESSDGKDVWGTVGVSENLIEASWIALVDSMSYKLLKDGVAGMEKAAHVAK
ncbi:MAG: citramalate synthase [Candidatus Latescibacteria bacterium]|nr:citramalate synthase [Candidatus Latescibacterota bacterium]